MNKRDLLATLEQHGVTKISCGSHCEAEWPLEWVSKNIDEFEVVRIHWTGESTQGMGYKLAHKKHWNY